MEFALKKEKFAGMEITRLYKDGVAQVCRNIQPMGKQTALGQLQFEFLPCSTTDCPFFHNLGKINKEKDPSDDKDYFAMICASSVKVLPIKKL